MQTLLLALFAVELSLLLAHEMDAVRKKEWNMFIILKDMEDAKAYRIFLLLHIPLYAAILFLLFSGAAFIGMTITDVFLIAHLCLHIGFRRHPANGLKDGLSQGLIFTAGLLAIVHLAAMIWLAA